MSSRVSKLWFPCIHVESTSLPRADNGFTSFANIPVRLLSSLLPLLMHERRPNQRGPRSPNVYTPSNFHIFKMCFQNLFLNHRPITTKQNKSFLKNKNYSIQNISITPEIFKILANSLIILFSSRNAQLFLTRKFTSRKTVQKSSRISSISYPTHFLFPLTNLNPIKRRIDSAAAQIGVDFALTSLTQTSLRRGNDR